MNIKTVLLCACAVLCTQNGPAWGGPILSTNSINPSDLNTPLGKPGKSYMHTYIGCASVSNGVLLSCRYEFKITELTQPNADVANNGGHTHTYSAHPLGYLRLGLWPAAGTAGTYLSGDTRNNLEFFQHEIPQASGKIQTVMNLRVPPGWYTVWPESCDASRSYWCTNTTVEVGLNNLMWLPNAPQIYTKTRHSDANHTDAVAYYGTSSALSNLKSIADWYNQITLQTLSINDMSLINGGVFDLGLSYVAIPHKSGHQLHRTGESADINQDIVNNVKLDCTKNKSLLLSVFFVMGRGGQPAFANRQPPSLGHFLCETTNNNNIHIDL